MIGKICVQKVGEHDIQGWFISPKRNEPVSLKRAMINMSLMPGMVLDVDYSWSHLSVLGVSDEKFHTQEVNVSIVVRVERPALGNTPEESLGALKEFVRNSPPQSLFDPDEVVGVKVLEE